MRLKRFQILSMLDMWLLLLRLQMVRFLRAFVWKEPAVSFIYVPNERPFSTCINNQDRPRSSALLLFETSLLMEKVQGCLVGPVVNFSLSLNAENRHLEFMVDYASRKTITLGELMPLWWGEARARQIENKGNE